MTECFFTLCLKYLATSLKREISSLFRSTAKSFVEENIKHYSFLQSSSNDEEINVNNSIILGSDLALALNVIPGENVKVLSSNMLSTPFGQIPKSQSMLVAGIFTSGMSEYAVSYTHLRAHET